MERKIKGEVRERATTSTSDHLEVVALGWLNLTPDQLDDFTPRELENKLVGFEGLEERRDRGLWEKLRLLASTLLTPHTKKGKGIRPEKLWPFKWDKKEINSEPMPKERLEYIKARSKALKKDGK